MTTKWWGWGEASKTFPLENRPDFWPFLERMVGSGEFPQTPPVSLETLSIPPSRLSDAVIQALEGVVGSEHLRLDAETRLRHAYGKSYRDLLRLRSGQIEHCPEAVVFPADHSQVQALLVLAGEAGLRVIPFGGGTSVVGGVEATDEGPWLTLSLARMTRVLHLDSKDRTAHIEAGALGPDIERALGEKGYTLGHFPQSFEFSTLGGWIATRSAGQQSTKYGKIEEMVVSLTMATPRGSYQVKPLPAKATGPDLLQVLVGSEGAFGVITEAVVRIRPKPHRRDYRGVLFLSFEQGVEAMRTMLQRGLEPATVRLSDARETQAFMKLREPSGPEWLRQLGKWMISRGGTRSLDAACMMILGFEGEPEEVSWGWEQAKSVLTAYEGILLGRKAGEQWFRNRFELPYLRDVLMDRGVMVDTLETATEWSNLLPLYHKVGAAIAESIKEGGVPGFVMCHLSHAYPDGASLYYTFSGRQAAGRELEQWQRVKQAATACLVRNGGALSHHHAVGIDHRPWIAEEVGSLGVEAIQALKGTFDPRGVMNPGKLVPPIALSEEARDARP